MANPNSQTSTGLQNLSSNQALRLLAKLKAVDLATAQDNAMQIINATRWSIKDVVIANASVACTTAAAAILTLPASAGTALLTATTLTNLTASTVVMDYPPTSTATQTAQTIYFRVTTGFTSAATADVFLYGYDFDHNV